MKHIFSIIFIVSILFLSFSCATAPTTARDRTLNLSGRFFSETRGVVRWYAVDKYNYDDFVDEVRFQVGYFTDDTTMGFVLYGTGNDGELAYFSRDGLDLRWDWGEHKNGGCKYSFIIEPDGTGLYYDFGASSDGTAKPRGIYQTHKF